MSCLHRQLPTSLISITENRTERLYNGKLVVGLQLLVWVDNGIQFLKYHLILNDSFFVGEQLLLFIKCTSDFLHRLVIGIVIMHYGFHK